MSTLLSILIPTMLGLPVVFVIGYLTVIVMYKRLGYATANRYFRILDKAINGLLVVVVMLAVGLVFYTW